jgi:metal-sulfur cluster biosynthetic enzyme
VSASWRTPWICTRTRVDSTSVVDPESALLRSLSLPPDVDTLAGRLRLVIDPELGVNIVDLGLVYRAEVVDGVAHVLMTTTTPACPIGSFLSDQVRWALLGVDGIHDVEVELTHEPRWSPERMSDEAKVQMGWA